MYWYRVHYPCRQPPRRGTIICLDYITTPASEIRLVALGTSHCFDRRIDMEGTGGQTYRRTDGRTDGRTDMLGFLPVVLLAPTRLDATSARTRGIQTRSFLMEFSARVFLSSPRPRPRPLSSSLPLPLLTSPPVPSTACPSVHPACQCFQRTAK